MRDQFIGDRIVLEQAMAFAIHHAYQRIRTTTYRAFREHDLDITPEQWMVLVRLWDRDALTPSELSATTLRDRPTMSRILDSMEARGLLVREPDATDGRGRVVRLTRAGRALRAPLTAVARSLVGRIERGIPEDDLAVTRRTLRRIFDNLA
ncbi:MAG TPA: MarR family transcriptional regulator [Gemmatimonadaceae bacterium]|nr:MarR family transcriptional regulator [Gemmatimonadaceae bacterium]